MKKITLLIVLMITSLGFSQDLLLGFETGESGGVLGGPFGGMAAPTVLTGTGTNTTKVLQIIGNTATDVWQGSNFTLSKNVRLTTSKTMTMDVKSDSPITFLAKVNGGISGAPEAAAEVNYTGNGEWQTVTFVFNTALDGKAATANGDYANFVIHAYWKAGETGFFPNVTKPARTFYVDNISGPAAPVNTCLNGIKDGDETGVDCGGSCAPCPSPPTTAAPTPPNRNSSDVISLYSGSYTNVPSNFDAGWCGINSVQEVSFVGNPAIAWKGNNCQGIDLNTGINASSFTNLHVDVYIEAGTNLTSSVFNLKFVQQPGGGALEINLNVASTPALVAGGWLQIDVPVNLSTFTNFKEFGITSNLNNKLWYDNLYVYKGTALGTEKFETSSVKMYPNPVKNTLTIDANSEIQRVSVYNILGQEVLKASPKANSVTLQTNELQQGVYMVTTEIDGKFSTSKVVKE
jgi:hypothetical protein